MNGSQSGEGRVVRGAATILVAVIIWFLPPPAGVAVKAWHLLAIFASTIVGLILQPLPMGAVVLIGTMATALTGTLSPADAHARPGPGRSRNLPGAVARARRPWRRR